MRGQEENVLNFAHLSNVVNKPHEGSGVIYSDEVANPIASEQTP